MFHEPPADKRQFLTEHIDCDLAVIGGGIAGVCCAITAARAGIKVTLIQDRPVLGGNASSEVRLWILGATASMGNNNRWAREGGVVDEILVECIYRNPESNPVIFDTILLEKVVNEPNITLLLNTAAIEAGKSDSNDITWVQAFCAQNSTMYKVRAPLFCDASGDGVLGFLAGAAFRMGAEPPEEFGEKFAPDEEYGELLGHSIYFYSKDTGKPVKFIPPSFALKDITEIPRFHRFNANTHGCYLWWIEYGGRLDTVHDTEKIKWELWKVVYGVWNYIKNSGKFPEAETLTLEWVGHIPGKRESRRFEGTYMLKQQDIVEQRHHDDAVSYGGWSIDLHPADGVYSDKPGCTQWHSRGVYQIPYRCLYSRNIRNLFLAGRIISASHVAFGSTRVMGTCGSAAQAVGMAAAICIRDDRLLTDVNIQQLQMELMRSGQYIPDFRLDDQDDLTRRAEVTSSSQLRLARLRPDGPLLPLTSSWAQMLPLAAGPVPEVSFMINAEKPTVLRLELRTSDRPDNYTPDVVLDAKTVELEAGEDQKIVADFNAAINEPRYVFFCLMKNENVSVRCSQQRVTGILSVAHRRTQNPPGDVGLETFQFWCPQRRPGGHNLAVTIDPPIEAFAPENVANGLIRPTCGPNAWAGDFDDDTPTLTLKWDQPQTLARIELSFDTDYDHPMATVLIQQPERAMPFCVKHYRICDSAGQIIAERTNNYQTRNSLVLDPPVTTDRLSIQLLESHSPAPAALFEVRCYGA